PVSGVPASGLPVGPESCGGVVRAMSCLLVSAELPESPRSSDALCLPRRRAGASTLSHTRWVVNGRPRGQGAPADRISWGEPTSPIKAFDDEHRGRQRRRGDRSCPQEPSGPCAPSELVRSEEAREDGAEPPPPPPPAADGGTADPRDPPRT